MAWADSFLRTLKENDVRLVTYVPDNVLTPLIYRSKLKIDYEDAVERLGFNPSFLLDALKVMEPTSAVRFEFTTGKSPGKLSDGEGYSYVVMPVSVE